VKFTATQEAAAPARARRQRRRLPLVWLVAAAAIVVVVIVAAVVLATRHHGSSIAEAATPAQFAALRTGMAPSAVKKVLGKTSRKCWDYGSLSSAEEICFDNGKVVSMRPASASSKLGAVSVGMREVSVLKQIGTPPEKCWLYGPAKSPDRLCFLNGHLVSKVRG
jgi:hypothetical protein